MTYGAGDWEAVGRLTLRRVNALYAAWERYPPATVSLAASIGYKSKGAGRRVRIKGKKDIAKLVSDLRTMGVDVGR